jgi:hypothetical protein
MVIFLHTNVPPQLNSIKQCIIIAIFLQFPYRHCPIFPTEALIGEAEVAVITDNDVGYLR